IPMPKCHGWHFEHHVTGCHIDAGEELQDKVLVISSKFPKMGFCSRIKIKFVEKVTFNDIDIIKCNLYLYLQSLLSSKHILI
ncbi:MAG: hypothetical protein N2489_10545, partial [Clostridia bacterium]|nr:hypothetical protein [Clostridia bacterium]